MFGSTNLFGQSSSCPFRSQSVFGQTNNASNSPFAPKPFGTTTPFGSIKSSVFGGTSTGVIGAAQSSSPFSSATTFGASSSPAFGNSMPAFGSSSSAFGGSSVFGAKPAFSFGSTPTQTSPFGGMTQQSQSAFGSSLFGSPTPFSTSSQTVFGATSTPAFGASSTPAFGAASTPAFGAASTPVCRATSSPAFGATSTPAFGSTGTSFGASSAAAFGSGGEFGASSTPLFGSSSTRAFGASGTPAFGASSTPAFGASSTPAFGASSTTSVSFGSSPAFGQSASAFGSSPFGTSTSPFGAQSSPFRSQATTPTFGRPFEQSNFWGPHGGSRVAAYTPTTEADTGSDTQPAGKLDSISAMPVYKDKIHEELRLEDYQLGDKGGPLPAGQSTGGIGFGVSAAPSSLLAPSSVFGASSANPFSSTTSSNLFAPKNSTFTGSSFGTTTSTAFGSSPFGGSSTPNPFGSTSSAPPSIFGHGPPSTSAFGANSSPSTFGSSPSLFNSTSAQGTMSSFGSGMNFGSQLSPLFSSAAPVQTGSCFGLATFSFGNSNTMSSFGTSNLFSTPSTGFSGGVFWSTSSLAPSSTSLFGQPTPSVSMPFQLGQPAQTGGAFGFSNLGQTQACGPLPAGQSAGGIGFCISAAPSSPFASSSVFGQSNFWGQHGGSKVASYTPTTEADTGSVTQPAGKVESICAMPVYKDKSHEELRWEDYQLGDKGGPLLTSQSAGGIGFGVSAAPSSPFAPSSVFEHSYFGGHCGGSRVTAYTPTTEADTCSGTQPAGKLDSISAMPVYKDQIHEELRWEDYQLGDKGGPLPAGQSAWGIGFGVSAAPSSPFAHSSVFGASSASPFSSTTSSNLFAPKNSTFTRSSFGTTTSAAFGTSPFGVLSTPNPFGPTSSAAPSIFGHGPTSTSAFGANSSPSTFSLSPSRFNSTAAQGTMSSFGSGMNFGSHSSPLFSFAARGQTGSGFGTATSSFGNSSTMSSFGTSNLFSTPSTGFSGGIFSSTSSLAPSRTALFSQPTLGQPAQTGGAFGFSNLGRTQAGGPLPTGQSAGGIGFGVSPSPSSPFAPSSVFGKSNYWGQRGGSRVAAYTRTTEAEDTCCGTQPAGKVESISAMPVYKDKTHEELRWEDYQLGDKGGPLPTSQSAGGNRFGVSATPSSPFAPSSVFEQSNFGGQRGGSRVAAYTPTTEADTGSGMPPAGKLESISTMPVYKDESHEKLRWEDYQLGDKGSSVIGAKPAFGFGSTPPQTSPFGGTTQQSQPSFGSSLFDSSTRFGASSQSACGATSTPAFGATSTPAFGAASTPAFCATSTTAFGATSSPAFGCSGTSFGVSSAGAFGFGGAFGASSTPLFGSSRTPAFGASSTPAFGASSAPAFGASSAPTFGASSTPAFGASSTASFSFGSSPAFGQSTSAFGSSPFGTSISPLGAESSPFGSQATTPTFGSTPFGQSNFGGQRGGSRVAAYTPTTEADTGSDTQPAGKLESISAMPVYKDKSHDKLRWEDYQLGDKGGPLPAGQSAGGYHRLFETLELEIIITKLRRI